MRTCFSFGHILPAYKTHLLLVLVLGCGTISAQRTLDANRLLGQANGRVNAFPFLLIAADARAGGFGDAGAASTPDAASITWNCAKLAFIGTQSGGSASTEPWLRALVPMASFNTLCLYHKLDSVQTLAASCRYFATGNVTLLTQKKVPAKYNASEYAIDLSYARKLLQNVSAGFTGRYCYSNLSNGGKVFDGTIHPVKALSADIGLFYHSDEQCLAGKKCFLNVGLLVSNIGKGVHYTDSSQTDYLPSNLRLGTAFAMALSSRHSLSILADANKWLVPGQPQPSIGGGLEYGYIHTLAIRAGYFWESVADGDRRYYTLGTGIRCNAVGFDFAYLIPNDQRSAIQNTIKFTLSVRLGMRNSRIIQDAKKDG